jgi:hypothetical protein
MNQYLYTCAALIGLTFGAIAQTAPQKPPIGVPSDAKWFNGKWYHVYLEQVTWERAKEKCAAAKGQLAVVPDAATWDFIKRLSPGRIWLGATDEHSEGIWKWVDGTPMTFKAWSKHEPNNYRGREHYLVAIDESWNDLARDSPTVGFICEWKAN